MDRDITFPQFTAVGGQHPVPTSGREIDGHAEVIGERLEVLFRQAGAYLREEQIAQVRQAYLFSAEAHTGQSRTSGEPFILHPIEVACILADMRMDHQALMAAMLHDVIEDTSTLKEEVAQQFGGEVAELVDGVSKLTQVVFDSHAEEQAQNFRKMLMAMCNDIRVILVKLADRLHNMRTLYALPTRRRRLIAHETLEIYAPIAQRLGMNAMRLELENLGFVNLYPLRHRVLSEKLLQARGNRKEVVSDILCSIEHRMQQEDISGTVHGREKHLYGIYRKMCQQGLRFDQVHDVYAFRIITEEVSTCYRLLGIVHNLYKPISGKFKDYIAIPKANGYQSLHTAMFGPHGLPIEVQIRTRDMHYVAEAGVAAHWLYKTPGTGDHSHSHHLARQWIRSIMEIHKTAGNPQEFFEHVKIDLFPDEVYVFTPKGDILELPRGATVVDFAYAIHSDIGNKCVATQVDQLPVPLSTPLRSGQSVSIICSPTSHPDPVWLNFVVTAKARSNIHSYLKQLQSSEAIKLGRVLLERELEHAHGIKYSDISTQNRKAFLALNHVEDMDVLLRDIGLGHRVVSLLTRDLAQLQHGEIGADEAAMQKPPVPSSAEAQPLLIFGTEGMVVSFPKCCYPIPGDSICGLLTSGRGIVIHRRTCRNIATDQKQHEDKTVPVAWHDRINRTFEAKLSMVVANQCSVLATIATVIADAGANIDNVEIKDKGALHVTLVFVLQVRDRVHLGRVMRGVHRVKVVSGLSRQ